MRRGGSREGGQLARRVPSHVRGGGSLGEGGSREEGQSARGGERHVRSCAEGPVARRGACHERGGQLAWGGAGYMRGVGPLEGGEG